MEGVPIASLLPNTSGIGVQFADELLALDPCCRPSASELNTHPYFFHQPLPSSPSELVPSNSSGSYIPFRELELNSSGKHVDVLAM
jgi:serine/threonine protein kinase